MGKTRVQTKRLFEVLKVSPLARRDLLESRGRHPLGITILLDLPFAAVILAIAMAFLARSPRHPKDGPLLTDPNAWGEAGMFAIVAFLVLFVPILLVVLWKTEGGRAKRIQTHVGLVRSEFEVLVRRSMRSPQITALADGKLVAYSDQGVMVADPVADGLIAVKIDALRTIELQTRPASQLQVSNLRLKFSAVSYNLASGPLMPGAVMSGSGGGRMVTVSDIEYASIVDLYLSDDSTPHVSLNFGPHEADAKRVRAVLEQAIERRKRP